MKVILRESLDNLGEIGDVVNVRDGYARNYLLPQGKAAPATAGELAMLAAREKKLAVEKAKILEEAKAIGEKLSKVTLTIPVKLTDEGQMYGSIGVTEIARLLEQEKFHVEKRQVLLPEPIKALGAHLVAIRLHHDVTVNIQVMIVEEKTEEKQG